MVNRVILIVSLIAAVIVSVMLSMTTPTAVGPFGVLVFFTMGYLILLGVVTGLVAIFVRIVGQREWLGKKDYAYAAVIAFGPLLLLLVRAFSAISLWTVGLSALFVLLGCFLVDKRV